MKVSPGNWSAVCAVALSTAALFSAAPASADQTDDEFIAALTKNGIVVSDHNAAIAKAHTVCAGFDNNELSSVVTMKVMKDAELSLKQASYFIGVSVAAYCPQYKGQTDNSVN